MSPTACRPGEEVNEPVAGNDERATCEYQSSETAWRIQRSNHHQIRQINKQRNEIRQQQDGAGIPPGKIVIAKPVGHPQDNGNDIEWHKPEVIVEEASDGGFEFF